jgi:hypothetical protein
MEALNAALREQSAELPEPLREAVAALAEACDSASLCRLIEQLYRHRGTLGEQRFGQMLGRVRQELRAGIDRRMEYSA